MTLKDFYPFSESVLFAGGGGWVVPHNVGENWFSYRLQVSLSWKYQIPPTYTSISLESLTLIAMSIEDIYTVRASVCKKIGVIKLSLSDHAHWPHAVL